MLFHSLAAALPPAPELVGVDVTTGIVEDEVGAIGITTTRLVVSDVP